MSNASEHDEIAKRAADIEARAADWLQRRHFWNWTDEDEARLNAWLSEALAHRVAFWRLNAGFSRTDRLAALRPAPLEAAASRRAFSIIVKLAAAFAVVAVLGIAGADYVLQPSDRTFATPVGGHESVTFSDGSRIELNTDTVLRARMTSDKRLVWLDRGEAFFEVKHDPAHPFVVMAGNRRVVDLGTKFSMRRDAGRLEVAVMQGRVQFAASGSGKHALSALLTSGDVAVSTPTSISVTRKSSQELVNQLGWRGGLLVFKHATLADAASEFNRYNRTKLVIADPAAARLKIYGVFRADNIDDFTRLAQMVLELHVTRQGDEIVITH